MKISILALGALATTASAGWIFPQAKEDNHRDPHHPSHCPPPHSSNVPTHAHVAYAAQSSPAHTRPCGHHHSENGQSSLGRTLDSVRVWLREHNLMNYHPFTPPRRPHRIVYLQPVHQGTPIWTQVKSNAEHESGAVTTKIDWRDPVFVDTDPSHPLSTDEMGAKIAEMIQHPSARAGYLLPMTSGSIRVVTSGPGYTHTREYYPGSARKEGDFRIPMTAGFVTSDSAGRRPYHAQYLDIGAQDDDDSVAQKIQAAIDEAQRRWREDGQMAPEGTYITGKGDRMDKEAVLRRIEELMREGDKHRTGGNVDQDVDGGRPMAPSGEKGGSPGPGWTLIRTGITASGKMIKLPMSTPMFPGEEPKAEGPVYTSDGEVRIISSEWMRKEDAHAIVQGQGRVHPHGHQHGHGPGPQYGGRPCAGHGGHGYGYSGWHHRRPQSFGGRLHRAMHRLHPAESLALAFVLGAGLGSIFRMLFMITLLLTRRIRCGRMSKEERQAKRAERRARRQAAKGQGAVRLEEEDNLSGHEEVAGAEKQMDMEEKA